MIFGYYMHVLARDQEMAASITALVDAVTDGMVQAFTQSAQPSVSS